jgi:hypothetical protein
VVSRPEEASLVFNVVWTGDVFTYLRPFVNSQMAWSQARFRFVANGCPPDQVALMEQFRSRHPDRVVEVLNVSPDVMVAHGVALDRVREIRDDGAHFCLIDPDIKANGPWLGRFCDLLADASAITSGREVWSDDNLVPRDHPGVAGEHFFTQDGFTFGSPHLSLYRRDHLESTSDRWGVGIGSAGPELNDEAKAAMASMGHDYLVYDTGKIINALLQHDGHRLIHEEHAKLVHIGGLAHFLFPPAWRTTEEGKVEPDWTRFESMAVRHVVARHAADVLRNLLEDLPAPPAPEGLDTATMAKLVMVEREITDLVSRYGGERPGA